MNDMVHVFVSDVIQVSHVAIYTAMLWLLSSFDIISALKGAMKTRISVIYNFIQ